MSALRIHLFLLLWGALLLPWPGGIHAHADDERFDHERAWHLQRTGEILPLEEILHRAQQRREGRVIEVELEEKHGRFLYEVEVADHEGRVWEMRFDAKQGEFLSEKEED